MDNATRTWKGCVRKKAYSTHEKASEVAAKFGSRVYYCGCGKYHITSDAKSLKLRIRKLNGILPAGEEEMILTVEMKPEHVEHLLKRCTELWGLAKVTSLLPK